MPLIGTGHIWLIGTLLIIVLIVWGPGKLPEVGAGMGRAIREFRKASAEAKAEFSKSTVPDTAVDTSAVTTGDPVTQVSAAPAGASEPESAGAGPGTARPNSAPREA